MKIDLQDFAAQPSPPRGWDDDDRGRWHWFWAKLFGERMPTSHDRAHLGNLVIKYAPEWRDQKFGDKWMTDARRVYRIGDLYVFDYGDTPFELYDPPFKMNPKDLTDDLAPLLSDNRRRHKSQFTP